MPTADKPEILRRIYPVRYYAIFLFAGDKQDSIMLFMPIENILSHGDKIYPVRFIRRSFNEGGCVYPVGYVFNYPIWAYLTRMVG
jgi:hypothetical protein